MKVLLSIKPEYAEKIFAGTKKYEFRRTIFKNPDVKTVVVYASSPVQKVIGEFEIDSIIFTDIENLWKLTEQSSDTGKSFFFQYYKGKEKGYAIKIGKTNRYETPLDLKRDFKLSPPQSFVYI
jgi:predicted transcriptional regulator